MDTAGYIIVMQGWRVEDYAPTATAIGKSNTKRRDLINTNVGRDLWIRGQSLIFSRS
jgi:hypothetical protein